MLCRAKIHVAATLPESSANTHPIFDVGWKLPLRFWGSLFEKVLRFSERVHEFLKSVIADLHRSFCALNERFERGGLFDILEVYEQQSAGVGQSTRGMVMQRRQAAILEYLLDALAGSGERTKQGGDSSGHVRCDDHWDRARGNDRQGHKCDLAVP